MKYLTTVDPATGLTPVDTYVEKQKLWANAQDEWDTAKMDAQSMLYNLSYIDLDLTSATEAAQSNPDNMEDGQVNQIKVLQEYNNWNQANYRKVGDLLGATIVINLY